MGRAVGEGEGHPATRAALDDARAELEAMRQTLSWRVTKPLRLARRMVPRR